MRSQALQQLFLIALVTAAVWVFNNLTRPPREIERSALDWKRDALIVAGYSLITWLLLQLNARLPYLFEEDSGFHGHELLIRWCLLMSTWALLVHRLIIYSIP